MKTKHLTGRCVIIGGAPIGDYNRIRQYLQDDDFNIYCDSGLSHMEGLGVMPSLIVGDFDSHENPHMDIETLVLPTAKDDTDTVRAVKEGLARGYRDLLLIGVLGARLDHSLVNVYALFDLDSRGCSAMAVDDYSEITVISPNNSNTYNLRSSVKPAGNNDPEENNSIPDGCITSAASDPDEHGYTADAYVDDHYPFFSLLNMTGTARGVTIRNARFPLEDGEITSEYQYATSNEVLPGMTAEITIREGRLLLIRDL